MTLDIGQFYIIFSIFAGRITATIAYFSPRFDLEGTLVDTLYTVVYLFFVFRLFGVSLNDLLRDVPLVIIPPEGDRGIFT
jgi:hypothetical protein